MASLMIMDREHTEIIYSLNGKIRYFILDEEVLYDEKEETIKPNWKQKLIKLIKEYGLNQNDGQGLCAFVYPLIEEGYLEYKVKRR